MTGRMRWMAVLGMTATSLVAASQAVAQGGPGAVISNGTIALGVVNGGALNVNNGTAGAPGYGGVGVRYVPNGWDGTYAGCTCEGWGAGISGGTFDGVWGGQNTATGGNTNLNNITFTSTATTASSTVTIRSGGTDVLQVKQDYFPSPATPNLYQVNVTLTNLTGSTLGVGSQGIRYRRTMDWDVPTPGLEVVSLTGWGATNLIGTSDNGFTGESPFTNPGSICAPQNSNFSNSGPCDHGANFDFAFPALAAGASQSLTIFYGAAANLAGVTAALGAVKAEVASWAFCGAGQHEGITNTTCVGPDGPTFIFGFQGVGGTVIVPTGAPEPSTVVLTITGLAGILAAARRRRRQA